jgi:hypothetical protein
MTEEGYYTNNISLECCAYRHKEETQKCELERMSIIGTLIEFFYRSKTYNGF